MALCVKNDGGTDSMTRARVKICGITRTEDAINAARLGADAIGLVFYDKSPRFINLETAKKITLALPPFVSKVGLFVDASSDEINTVLAQVPLDILQFHGNETPEQCNEYSMPYIKAVRMQNGIDIYSIASQYSDAIALLLDAYVEGIQGGTGEIFDWSMIPNDIEKPIMLAGGLTPTNVSNAIHQVSPYAVDVSGGVESDKGIKDITKIAEFMREVINAQS
jgi:phosphoribosylanthranilate isomerase